ncbi:MAG: DcaP family trimeric outer membrane transporter [Kiritimatiellia bacterium]|nr:hypothetical protein [Lentisphaerota bacterium]
MTAAAQTAPAQAPAPDAFSFKLYGYVKLDASYDTHDVVPGDLMFYALPHKAGVDDDSFRMTARETRIGLNIIAPEVNEIATSGKLEVDFYGNGGGENTPNLRLRLAYVDLTMPNGCSLRAGQDWETFITVIPKIVNFSYLADAGALGLRRPQLRATKGFKLTDTVKLTAKLAAARTIGQDIDGYGKDDGVDAGLPTAQGNLILEAPLWTARPAKISVSGHAGRETLDRVEDGELLANDDKDYSTWSVIGSLYLPLLNNLTLQGSVWRGENLDTYFGGIGQGINKTLQTSIAAQGGFAQLLLDVNEKLNFNIGYGMDDPDDGDLNLNDRSKNQILFTSLFYKLTPAATLAVEYSNLQTDYKGSDNAENNRVQGAVIYNF